MRGKMEGELTVKFHLLLILCLIGHVVRVRSVRCSTFCECDTWYQLRRASCIGRHLYSIHTDAPNNVQALDLSNNSISSLLNMELADAGFTGLKYLNLSENSIGEIGADAFHGLDDLTILDLSKNHLHYLLWNTFFDSKNLRVLKLSKNNFDAHVPKLQCPSLTDLSMDSCLISHLPVDIFNGLGQLHNLDLSNNLMIQLDITVVRTMPVLRKLSLEGNPWSCNNNMLRLEEYLQYINVQFVPVCLKKMGPKKFEKLVYQGPQTKLENHHRRPGVHKPVAKPEITWHTSSPSSIDKKDFPAQVPNTTVTVISTTNVSEYWFLVIGFFLGCATSMLVCYLWLATKICWCQRRGYSHQSLNDPQRIFLLHNLWHVDEQSTDENPRQSASCPGTPPPPYRDVMLRPEFYSTCT